jgi:hypothetical protein
MLSSLSRAQQVELFGYYEPQFFGIAVNDGSIHLFTNKLRVDLQSTEYENVTFAANFDFINYSGLKTWNFLYFVPDEIAASIHPTLYYYYRFTYNDSIFLDNAYVKITFPLFDLTLGRQQISLGTGYVWNPTDLFNYKSLTDPTYEQPGHDAFRLDAPISSRFNFSLLYGPEKDWKSSTKLARIKGGLGHFDFSAIFIEMREESTDSYIEYWFGGEVNDYSRRLFGGDMVGELLGLGIWGEFAYNRLEDHDNFNEIDAGIDYTLDNGLYLLAEYYRNERAKSDYREFELDDWLAYFTAESKTISRDNLYFYLDYPLTDLIHVNNSIVGSINDGSLALVPGMNYSFRQNIDIDLFLNLNLGDDLKAYTAEQGQGGILRMRIYF